MKVLASKIGSLFLEQPLVEVIPIVGKGRINRIYLVQGKSGEVIVRLNESLPVADAWDVYNKERWCLEQAASVGVPGPIALQLGVCDGHAYMVQSCVPGINAEDSSASKLAIWHEIGCYARLIHGIVVPVDASSTQQEAPKGLSGPLSIATHADWLRYVQREMDALSDCEDTLGDRVYPRSQQENLLARLQELKTLPFRSGLNHGDLSLKNIIVDPEGGVHLLDWGSALVHAVPYYDLLQMLKNQVESNDPDAEHIAAFLSGYGFSASEMQDVCAKAALVLLLRALGKARWALSCHHPWAESFASLARNVWTML